MKTKKLTIGLSVVTVAVIIAMVVLFATSAEKKNSSPSREADNAEKSVQTFATVPDNNNIQTSETKADHYAAATSLPVEEVEQYAMDIRSDIMDRDWESLAGKISYPISLNDITINDSTEFLSLDMDTVLSQEFVNAIKAETCRSMFCNWQGISMGATGQIWFASVDNGNGQWELKIIGINDMMAEQPVEESRESHTSISCMLEGMQEEMPATLYVGDGFSIYIPDEGWIIYDETLEEPTLMTAVRSSEVSVWIACYEEEEFSSVESRFLAEGYAYDTSLVKLQKMNGNILTEARLYEYKNNVWAVFSAYNETHEWGPRLDAIAATFAVNDNTDGN